MAAKIQQIGYLEISSIKVNLMKRDNNTHRPYYLISQDGLHYMEGKTISSAINRFLKEMKL